MATVRQARPRWPLAMLLGLSALASTEAPRAAALPAPMDGVDAWDAAKRMGLGINIGNTLDNPSTWETGWGNPQVSKGYIQALASYGFRTVRLPVAWDSYARNGRISKDKLARVGEIADWITAAGMHCVVNIHWDGGWINSGDKKRFDKDYATFTPEAERKFKDYWTQIASYFSDRNELLVFEAMRDFCTRNDIPAFVGEFAVNGKKEPESRKRWMLAVARAALMRHMVPVLWEVGGDIQRGYPYYPDRTLRDTLVELLAPPARQTPRPDTP